MRHVLLACCVPAWPAVSAQCTKPVLISMPPGLRRPDSRNCSSHCPSICTCAGIGENSAPMRREMTRDMEFAGVVLDDAKNVQVG